MLEHEVVYVRVGSGVGGWKCQAVILFYFILFYFISFWCDWPPHPALKAAQRAEARLVGFEVGGWGDGGGLNLSSGYCIS